MLKIKTSVYKIIFLFITVALLTAGCAKKEPSEQILAVINDYKMTVEDFNYESREVLRTGIGIDNIAVTKEDILDALIIKEVLLQEAQKMGLDKDKNFMKSIELYWEQTLLKNLLTGKSREIKEITSVYEDEITDYYNKMKEKIRAKILVLSDEKTGRKLLALKEDVAEYAEQKPDKSSLLYIIPSRIYTLGEDSTILENSIFSIDKNKDKELIAINGNWAVIIIEERIPVEVKPLSAVRSDIIEFIRMRKERGLMNEWIDTLRSKARIKINKNVLSELQ